MIIIRRSERWARSARVAKEEARRTVRNLFAVTSGRVGSSLRGGHRRTVKEEGNRMVTTWQVPPPATLNNTRASLSCAEFASTRSLTSGTVARCIRVEWRTGRFRVTNPPSTGHAYELQQSVVNINHERYC